ncbi:hypothetical protein DFJ73DRAFT_780961 [Zopfochytrium polystomum]|nr:hypothetical protein DFJ73DRAFT_780961 [Zopfochytrium polystomum]
METSVVCIKHVQLRPVPEAKTTERQQLATIHPIGSTTCSTVHAAAAAVDVIVATADRPVDEQSGKGAAAAAPHAGCVSLVRDPSSVPHPWPPLQPSLALQPSPSQRHASLMRAVAASATMRSFPGPRVLPSALPALLPTVQLRTAGLWGGSALAEVDNERRGAAAAVGVWSERGFASSSSLQSLRILANAGLQVGAGAA